MHAVHKQDMNNIRINIFQIENYTYMYTCTFKIPNNVQALYRPPKVRIAYVIKAVTVEGVSNRKKFRNFYRQPFWLATFNGEQTGRHKNKPVL